MTRPMDPTLPEFASEALELDAGVTEHDRDRYREALGADLPLLLAPLAPTSAGRDRLLATIAQPGFRYLPFVSRLCQMFDLDPQPVQRILERLSEQSAWEPGPVPGVELMHFDAGPRLAGVDTGLVRMIPGLLFPTHRHHGVERVLILQGGYVDDTGKHWQAGDVQEMIEGTTHSYRVSDHGLLFALALAGGIQLEG